MKYIYFWVFFSCCFCKLDEKKIVFSKGLNVGTKDKPFYLKKDCKFESEKEFELKKFSEVKKNKNLSSRNLLTRAPVVVSSTPHTLTDNIDLSATDTLEFDNASPGSDKDMVLNGDGHFLSFPAGSSTQGLILDENVDLTVNDTVLKNYNPAAISFAGAGGTLATISFGDDCIVELGVDQTIADADAAWTFTGDATLNGFGNTLRIEKASGLTVADSKTVTLKNLKIITTVVDGLKCLGNDAHLKLQDCQLVLQDAGFDFDTGHLDIAGIVILEGSNLSDQDRTEFLFSTGGNLTIGENAILKIEPHINFKYDTAANSQIVFSYPGSTLHLNGCGIESGDNGIKLMTGTMIIENLVDFVISTVGGGEAEVVADMKIILLSGAKLNVQGPLIYIPVILTLGSSFTLRNELYNAYLRMDTPNPIDMTPASSGVQPENRLIMTNGLQDTWGVDILTANGDGSRTYFIRQASSPDVHLYINSLQGSGSRVSYQTISGSITFHQYVDFLLASHPAASASSQNIPITSSASNSTSFLPYGQNIVSGSRICFYCAKSVTVSATYPARTAPWFHALSSTTVDALRGTYGELNAPPSDDSHIWIVENVINGDYLNYP